MQHYPRQVNKKKFFLLSLLLHVLLLLICILFIAYHNYHKSVVNPPIKDQKDALSKASTPPSRVDSPQKSGQEPPPLKDESQEQAELKAQQSSFGAPVVFMEMPEIQPSIASNQVADDQGHHNEELIEEAESAFKNQKSEIHRILGQQQPPEKPESKDRSPDSLPSTLGQPVTEQHKAQDILEQTLAALENKEPAQETQKQLQTKKPRNLRKPSPKGATNTAKNKSNAKRSAGPIDKKFSFADLANGFLNNINNDGQDLINQRGNPNIRPLNEQLKQSSYRQKLAWSLQAAFKRAARRTKFFTPSPTYSRFECIFTITKEGELRNLKVIRSTGHDELDSYILKTTKDAFPLPPIPDHWSQDMLEQCWVFSNIQPDESSYVVNF